MAVKVGDLWPSVSGGSSLGVDQYNPSTASEIRPFARVHSNSGIFHGSGGTSGVIRYSSAERALEFSSTGGVDYLIGLKKEVIAPAASIPIDETGISGVIQSSNGLFISAYENIRLTPRKDIQLFAPTGVFIAANSYSYIRSPSIILDSTNEIVVESRKVYFQPIANNTSTIINISGTLTRPSSGIQEGDLYLFKHSALEDLGARTQASTEAEANAKSLGYDTFVYNTGSGFINISTGSGILQALNSSAMSVTTVSQRLPINSTYESSDRNYIVGTGLGSGQITILTPGLYKAAIKVLSSKTVGASPQTVQSQARLNSSNILGSTITSFHYDAVNAAANAASTVCVFNANAGDIFDVVASSTLSGGNNCTVGVRGAVVVIEKIGPRRGTAA